MSLESTKIQYVLRGFSDSFGFRIFAFESAVPGRPRPVYAVRVELDLIRRYGIRIQELPLLCRVLLDQLPADEDRRAFTYTEAEMCSHALLANEREQAALKRKGARRPFAATVASPWRTSKN